MAHNESFEFFLRAVEERFAAFKNKFGGLIAALAAEDLPAKKKAAEEALESLDALLALISQQDHPPWATRLRSEISLYVQKHKTSGVGNRLAKAIIYAHSHIHDHEWQFAVAESNTPVNFEEIFKSYYEASRVPELFQRLLDNLQKIVDSGAVDSIRAIEALQKLIATIRQNMRGSYFATVGTTHFAHALFKNYLWNLLKKVPGIGEFLEAIAETMKEMDVEMSEVHAEVRKALEDSARGDVEAISYDKHEIPPLPGSDEPKP